jgi:recombination endonuclease VII
VSTLVEYLRHVERTYGLKPEEYRALFYAQGGRCYGCRKASGKARRLGVDHDHLTGEVRALVCTGSRNAMTCNRLIAIYNRAQLLRAAAILSDPPPARAVLTPLRAGELWLPSLVDGPPFQLSDVKGAVDRAPQ